ncbi:MAG TPA: phospho-N-acetylmuramoyl-pentapeptide-transferase [Candidatus Dormibacteraeota bacterium]|nr:phospho-N-acetylmuramoyl-pentapeptide-transferase [Candidatus Dormibacteraeota bacterium]
MRSTAAFVLALVVGVALYPYAIGVLARAGAGQQVSAYAPASHRVKMRTPTMGGIGFCVLAALAWVVLDRGRDGFVAVFAIAAGAGLGALDDLANVRGLGALGLIARQKLAGQAGIGLLVGIGLDVAGETRQVIPGFGAPDLGWAIVPLTVLAVLAASNAVNLTDGVDGLCATVAAISLATLWALAAHAQAVGASVVAAALLGGVLAFLAYNWWPARVFMGDTGSLALGCGLVVLAAEVRLLWLLPILGIVFVAETLSVVINVTAITRFGRRVFLASPLHHHFEEKGIRERRLVVTFGAAAVVAAAVCAWIAVPAGVGA